MATKNKRKAQKDRQRQRLAKKRAKLDKRKKKVSRENTGAAIRQAERLARQSPTAWEGELVEDVAVFDLSVRETLSAELAEQAVAVAEALQLVHDARYDDANTRLSQIPRSSSYSQWRLFVRGLIVWLEQNDLAAARKFWNRLQSDRRPGRMAAALIAAHRTDLDEQQPSEEELQLEAEQLALDKSLLYAAKLVRRLRIDRKAIALAEQGTSRPEEASELKIGPNKIKWLRQFTASYRNLEPALVRALEQVALNRAFTQGYIDLFQDVTAAFAGPPHDPQNNLLSYQFHCGTKQDSKANLFLKRYLTKDLPSNTQVSPRLQKALESQIHLEEARSLAYVDRSNPFFMFSAGPDQRAIGEEYQKSIQAYPANRVAHQEYVSLLREQAENGRLQKSEQQKQQKRLTSAMKAWSKAIPDEVEPRLWLIDHFLENEETEQAKPHVDWMSNSRHDDPRVRATPWKWCLLEASRLCRRKTWLDQAREKLAEAEELWPKWLSRDWLPYLKAAQTLRSGAVEEFQKEHAELCAAGQITQGSIADACMMLSAGQRMRVPANLLKPLREPVDQAVKSLDKIPREDLVSAGNFFWDLHRTSLMYPAYRRHGSKFAEAFMGHLKKDPRGIRQALKTDTFQNAILWLSNHRFCGDGYDFKLPPAVEDASLKQPKVAAAVLNGLLALRTQWRVRERVQQFELVREAARSETDPYYRYWFGSLVEQLEEAMTSQRNSMGGLGGIFQQFANMMGGDLDDLSDQEAEQLLDEMLDYDPNCNCPECTAARKAAGVL